MLTDEQVLDIQKEKPTLSSAYIRKVDEDWNEAVQNVRKSGKNINEMKIVPEVKK